MTTSVPFRRAVLTMGATSFLVPAVGLITAPVLARALGADGRGVLAGAMAPAALILGVATLGLPDALTYYLAKDPARTRAAIAVSSLAMLVLGGVCVLLSSVTAPFFAGGDPSLASLIVLAAALTVPSLLVNLLRGAAAGRQEWGSIAIERVVGSILRVVALVALLVTDRLTILSALLVLTVGPLIAALPYLRLLKPVRVQIPVAHSEEATFRNLLSFGSSVWFGSVASMLLSRSDQLLMVPLSSTKELGLYIVANTISDLPIVVSLAVQSAVFGVNSKTRDAAQITSTSRIVTFAAFLGCAIVGATMPFWITPLFGPGFVGAVLPALLLMLGSVICIPSLIAAAGISAWGRPALRSICLVVTFAVNLAVLIWLVPLLGAVGGGFTSVISNLLMSTLMTTIASRLMGVRITEFLGLRAADLALLRRECLYLLRRIRSGLQRN